MDGIPYPTYECHCYRCGQAALGLGRNRVDATRELTRRGWARGVDKDKTMRVYYCDECTLLGWADRA